MEVQKIEPHDRRPTTGKLWPGNRRIRPVRGRTSASIPYLALRRTTRSSLLAHRSDDAELGYFGPLYSRLMLTTLLGMGSRINRKVPSRKAFPRAAQALPWALAKRPSTAGAQACSPAQQQEWTL